MINQYYCNFCDKTLNKKRKSKHHKTETHQGNEKKVIFKYHIEKPDLFQVLEIKIKNINEFFDDFGDGNKTCNFSLLFNNGLFNYNTNTMTVGQYLVLQRCGYLVFFEGLLTNFEKGYIFINVSHLTIRTTTTINSMTKSFYLKQRNLMLE